MIKTLFITSIYSNLYGTELGGRPSRERHYKESLLNILNMSPTKCICFTSKKEYDILCNFFYEKNNVSEEILEIRIFDLFESKYFNKIKEKKDKVKMLTFDRCYEIQYNKFFWFDLISNRFEYDRIYWIDAGLSHGGLFPKQYRLDDNIHGSYKINLFTKSLLEKINHKTDNKIILLSKNNGGRFFWSQTVPTKYYNMFDRSRHIIGGMFGGTPKMYNEFKILFEELLNRLLTEQIELYMEEQIMSCLYVNNKNLFITEEFDDWFQRKPDEINVKYFYNMFE